MEVDVLIVGAGPAGSTLARLLAPEWKVLLLDGQTQGKPCGGLLAPDAQKALARFDLSLPKSVLVDPQIFSVKTIDVAARLIRWYPRMYLNVDRKRFDAWLLSLAAQQATVVRGRCLHMEREGNGFAVTYRTAEGEVHCVRAKRLVGADGAASCVRRAFFPALHTREYVAVQQWFKEDLSRVNPFYSCIFDPETTDCCAWSIHKDGYLIYGGAFAKKNCRAQFEKQKQRLGAYGFSFGEPEKTEACLVLRPTSPLSFQCGGGEVYLTGEAAGFISPSSLEGISSAIVSAVKLADSLHTKHPLRTYRRKTLLLRVKLLCKNIKCLFMYVPFFRHLVMRSGITAIAVQTRE